ncbi:MAG: carboxypeptidase regulatory-like domain-containing protein, partial [Terriglobales bacterium]
AQQSPPPPCNRQNSHHHGLTFNPTPENRLVFKFLRFYMRADIIGPGLATLDLSLLKDTKITEKLDLQFRAEFFNALNRANFNTPNLIVFTSAAGVPSPTAGVITSTSTTSRQIQFGLKFIW